MGEEWIREREQYIHRSRCLEGRQYKRELSEVILEREAGARWWCRQQMLSILLVTVPQFCSDAEEKNHDWSKPAQEISFPFGQQCRCHCLKGVIIIRTEWVLRAPWQRDSNWGHEAQKAGNLCSFTQVVAEQAKSPDQPIPAQDSTH